MARYAAFLGQLVQVRYHAGEILLPATGTLAADSGKSIFLENYSHGRQDVKKFRWEIPYTSIVDFAETRIV